MTGCIPHGRRRPTASSGWPEPLPEAPTNSGPARSLGDGPAVIVIAEIPGITFVANAVGTSEAFGYGWSDLERLAIIDEVIKPRYAVLVG